MSEKQEWKEKRVSLGSAIVVSAIFAVAGVVLGANWNNWFGKFAPYLGLGEVQQTSDMDWSSLNEVYNELEANYDGEIDKNEIIEGAKKGLVSALGDRYTAYMDAETAQDFEDDLHGNLGAGVGIEMGLRDGYVRVLRTLPDNPARRAGILAGDIFYKIDGEAVYNSSSEEIASKLRGEAGTEVTLSMVRDGEEKSFTLKRETLNNVSAYVEYSGSTAIVTLTRFDTDTGTMVQGFAKEFEGRGIEKVILDLRNNGGGYISAAQDLLSLWIDSDTVVVQKSKHHDDVKISSYSGKALLKNMKTVVLVNGSTASASEIVTGALQDYGKATVVGEMTFGKGVVQELINLSGGSLLKVTVASWYTPKGRTINGTGITPDIEVERSYEDINAMRDPQMDKAKKL
ncbi:S41 family peptidase [Candidatus Saccharibacteria bacterium]|nr:S41 family peptidase [Candidatus Saccharibacteria bacterium]